MTREEAIKALKQLPDIKEAYNKGYKDGQEMVSFHLELCKEEQEPFINKPCVSSGVCEHDKQRALDKIRAEIDRQQKWLLQAGHTVYNVDIALDAIKAVVAESEENT